MRRAGFWLVAACAACAASDPPRAPAAAATRGHLADGAVVEVALDGERIAALEPRAADPAAGWLTAGIIDSHVHLAYWPVAGELAATGIAAVVDLGAPEPALDGLLAAAAEPAPAVLVAGPLLTRPAGYPLDSWGAAGYGLGCADAPCVTAAVDRLAAAGARVIKVAADADGLDPALLAVAVAAAHARGLRVAAHALGDDAAARAAAAGVDLLAHTPTEPLAPATVAAWRGRAVISTLAAFGGGAAAIANLRALRAAGVDVLYGTDLGNLRDAGPSAAELAALARAGLDDAAIVDAMTTAPAAYWGLPLGVAAGREASFVVTARDPRTDARQLLAPTTVYLRGRRVR